MIYYILAGLPESMGARTKMKSQVKIFLIPILLFCLIVVFPKYVMFMFNTHTYTGIVAIILPVAVMFAYISGKVLNFLKKGINNEDS